MIVFDTIHRIYSTFKSLKLLETWQDLKYCPHPWHTLRFLIWPFPWKYPLPPLLTPLQILAHPNIVHQRYYKDESYNTLRAFPLFKLRDTPLRSLYRLHDALCANSQNYTMIEGYYFWHQGDWRIKDIPDPKDPDPLRYAILASLVEAMAEAYNWKMGLGLRRGVRFAGREAERAAREEADKPLEEVPGWAGEVPPVGEWVSFLEGGRVVKENSSFCRRRICANANQLENI